MGSKMEKRRRKNNEWDRAAQTVGLSVTRRSLFGLGPTRLNGAIGRYVVAVFIDYGEQGGITCVVGLPPGPWDDHKITIKKRGRLRRSARVVAGDDIFDDKYTVQLRRGRRGTSATTRGWIGLFLTPARRQALLELQNRPGPVRLMTGIRRFRLVSWAGVFAPVECRSVLVGSAEEPSGDSVATSVRTLVTCAEVLVEGH